MGQIGCPKTMATYYPSTLHKVTEEQGSSHHVPSLQQHIKECRRACKKIRWLCKCVSNSTAETPISNTDKQMLYKICLSVIISNFYNNIF